MIKYRESWKTYNNITLVILGLVYSSINTLQYIIGFIFKTN